MKYLEKCFIKNCESVGDTVFTQLKQQECNGLNAYIYKREKKGFLKYEAFVAKRRYKGQALPGGNVEQEDREQYPTANHFGFTAKEFGTLIAAQIFFESLLNKPLKIPSSPLSPLDYPITTWTASDLMAANPSWTKAKIYAQIKKDFKSGKIKKLRVDESKCVKGQRSMTYCLFNKA